jgi:Mn2+/Fe2+ NRAMP family transporter
MRRVTGLCSILALRHDSEMAHLCLVCLFWNGDRRESAVAPGGPRVLLTHAIGKSRVLDACGRHFRDDHPYLFFWQASQEVEEIKDVHEREPLVNKPKQGLDAIYRIHIDTYIRMGFSNLVALAIMFTTAATLHAGGVTDIQTSSEAAEALKPIAGGLAFAIFTLGIVGTGLLAVPVLAGSAAYALGEAQKWPIGLARKPMQAKAFYATIVIATLSGIAITFSPLTPIKALFWSAVINGVVSVPVMVMMMLITSNKTIMGEFVLTGALKVVGWLTTAVMTAAALGMGIAAQF